jgi:hypothetical protein
MIPYSPQQNISRKRKMEAFKFAQVKYELGPDQRRALGDHPNYEEAMFRAWMGSLGAYENWRGFESLVADVLGMEKQ